MAKPVVAEQDELIVAKLLATISGHHFCTDHELPPWVRSLDPDAACRLIWLLGWILPGLRDGVIRSGRHAPNVEEALLIARYALDRLTCWPDAFLLDMQKIEVTVHSTSASYLDRALTSLHRFVVRELADDALDPVRQAYQAGARALWVKWNRIHSLRMFGTQLHLGFETPFDAALRAEDKRCLQ
ncbi:MULTISPECIES: hypothetical protein [Silvimonas]|uniref:hypothetical protein n=1 Tax=Silvimonas TaxID=300264 RepID=UPI001E35920F|nr:MULTISPECIES: hypothetical protein [Silvimonas]